MEVTEVADREVTCKMCDVTNQGSTVFNAFFGLEHDNSWGCNRLTALYTYKDQQGETIYSGDMNSEGKML